MNGIINNPDLPHAFLLVFVESEQNREVVGISVVELLVRLFEVRAKTIAEDTLDSNLIVLRIRRLPEASQYILGA